MERKFVSIDLEVSGTDPRKDRIIRVDAVEFIKAEPRQKFFSLVNPGISISRKSGAIARIGAENLQSAPSTKEVLEDFLKFLGIRTLVTHHADFNMGFINAESERNEIDLIANTVEDTSRLAKQSLVLPTYSLTDVARRLKVDSKALTSEKTGYVYLALQKLINDR